MRAVGQLVESTRSMRSDPRCVVLQNLLGAEGVLGMGEGGAQAERAHARGPVSDGRGCRRLESFDSVPSQVLDRQGDGR